MDPTQVMSHYFGEDLYKIKNPQPLSVAGSTVEAKGVKSNYFGEDLVVFRKNYSQG